jgi:hypothetical protein
MTEEMLRLLKKVREAGHEGLYLGLGGHDGRVAPLLVEAGLASYREVRHIGSTTVSSSSSELCKWTEYYLVLTKAGRAEISTQKH